LEERDGNRLLAVIGARADSQGRPADEVEADSSLCCPRRSSPILKMSPRRLPSLCAERIVDYDRNVTAGNCTY